jgi:hypothetical protein
MANKGRHEYEYTIAQCDVPQTSRAALESYRAKRLLWLTWIDTDEHHAIWTTISSMVWTDVSFRTLAEFAVKDENSGLTNTLLGEALIDGHVATQVLAIRRLMDDRNSDIISLRRLVKDLRRNWDLFNRENYVCFDGLPYDYAAVEQREMMKMVQSMKRPIWVETTGPGGYSASRMAHEQFDRLAGIDPGSRNRADRLPVSLLTTIETTWWTGAMSSWRMRADRRPGQGSPT